MVVQDWTLLIFLMIKRVGCWGGGGEWVVGGGWGLGGGCGRGGLGAGVGGYEKIKTAIHKVVTANSGVA